MYVRTYISVHEYSPSKVMEVASTAFHHKGISTQYKNGRTWENCGSRPGVENVSFRNISISELLMNKNMWKN